MKKHILQINTDGIDDLLLLGKKQYSIVGWFIEDYNSLGHKKAAYAFGGNFKYYKESNRILGNLADTFGPSKIREGYMDSQKLKFTKSYSYGSFYYTFKKENGIWIGEYEGIEKKCKAKAISKPGRIKDVAELEKLLELTKF